MKILVPVDFSAHSKNAAGYAAKMAQKCNAEIILLNLVFLQAPPHAAELNQQNIENLMISNAKQDCVQLMEELKTKNKKLPVSYEVINDFNLKEVIENYAVHNNIDLIIMGTKGATGLSKVLLGSNTAAVIGSSSIPVIAVPQHARFNGIKQIVYASDVLSIHKELTAVIPIVKKFKAHLQIVHVLQPDSKKRFDRITLTNELRTKHNYDKLSFSIRLHSDVEDGIAEFISENKCDLLVMFTHNPGFLEKLFGRSSTREMVFETWIPLLTFNKELIKGTKKNLQTRYQFD